MPTASDSTTLPLPFLRDGQPKPACADPAYDPEWWHPGPGQVSASGNTAKALAICSDCPLREPCKEHAIEAGEEGIWGALRPGQLKAEQHCRHGRCLHPDHRRWSDS